MGDLIQFPSPGRRQVDEELARGRRPLYVDSTRGRISDSPRGGDPVARFGERMAQIRARMKEINMQMAELRGRAEPELTGRTVVDGSGGDE